MYDGQTIKLGIFRPLVIPTVCHYLIYQQGSSFHFHSSSLLKLAQSRFVYLFFLFLRFSLTICLQLSSFGCRHLHRALWSIWRRTKLSEANGASNSQSDRVPSVLCTWWSELAPRSVKLAHCALIDDECWVQSNRKYAAMKVEARMEEEEDEVLRMDVFVLSKVQDFDKFCTIYDYSQNERFS